MVDLNPEELGNHLSILSLGENPLPDLRNCSFSSILPLAPPQTPHHAQQDGPSYLHPIRPVTT
ncbi:MAG: hypothetical protein QXK42_02575 [Candidatus Korarchaeum sp.]